VDPPYDPSQETVEYPHTSAKCGRMHFRIGDIVQIESGKAFKWIGLIRGFATDYYYHSKHKSKRVILIWFCRQQDFTARNRRKNAHAVIVRVFGTNMPGGDIHYQRRGWNLDWIYSETCHGVF
jgi:hypothetical protein